MRQVVRLVRDAYQGSPPNKTTIWRTIKKLQETGRLEAKPEKVVRVFTRYWLSIPGAAVMDFDDEFSALRRGEKLRIAVQAREAVKKMVSSRCPARLSPVETLSRRSEGELSVLAETARISFERFFEPSGERSYTLRG